MNRFFYLKLAVNNIRVNSKKYIPYVLTCIGTIMMFYNMSFLANAKQLGSLTDTKLMILRSVLNLGSIVIAVFSVIFLFYTNSFLIKQRKKEFGLFNILGMEKKHIARIIFTETLLVAVVSITIGILTGILLSKLIVLFLFKLISFNVNFTFEIPLKAIMFSLGLFIVIYTLNLIYNLCQVHLAKPIELLKGGYAGEKEPKTKKYLAVVGTLCLGTAYYIALTTESPLKALNLFLIAVILTIAGTYCLFIAGSIAVLKMLRKNKKYYYRSKHFTSISGMIYRMKQNAAGLANICILSTAVIVMISATVSLYIGAEDALHLRYPKNIIINAEDVTDEQKAKFNEIIQKDITSAGASARNTVSYSFMNYTTSQKDSSFTATHSLQFSDNNFATIFVMTIDDYNKMENKSVTLSGNEMLLYTLRGEVPGDSLSLNGLNFKIKERVKSLDCEGVASALLSNSYYIIVDNQSTMQNIYNSLEGNSGKEHVKYYYIGFDIDGSKDTQSNLVWTLDTSLKNIAQNVMVDGLESARGTFISMYGVLFFLGIFLGLLFIMATVLIIYYKQIAEGYDDKERFEIMQKVGMSHSEVRKSIRSQVLTVFFLPLGATLVHLIFAFKVITKLLLVFNLTNVPLFAACTLVTFLVFAIFYGIVYLLTARTYYKIVS